MPRLYQSYIGHDNNRDFYMMNQPESENATASCIATDLRIMHNHHQTGPAGAVLFAPPFRDPFNYNFDPLVVLGSTWSDRPFTRGSPPRENRAPSARTGAPYSTWFNGGIRTTALSQSDRHSDRDHRQSHARRNSVRARHAAAARRRAESDCAADLALSSVDRNTR
jgi:hypothetical protein